MNAKRVERCPSPKYPTAEQVASDPSLLREQLPPAWEKLLSAGVVGVLLLGTVGGCDSRSAPPNGGTATTQSSSPNAPGDVRGSMAAVVAPIFAHGDGRGATGCVVVSPPSFLSEEEALQVIQEELAKVGVELSSRKVVLPEVGILPRTEDWVTGDGDVVRNPEHGEAKPLELQFVDPKHHVGIEFVGKKNYLAVGGEHSNSTVQGYDFLRQANLVAQDIRQKAKGLYVGVLYDPAVAANRPKPTTQEAKDGRAFEQGWKTSFENARASSREELRQQVRDLAAWLKQQGAL